MANNPPVQTGTGFYVQSEFNSAVKVALTNSFGHVILGSFTGSVPTDVGVYGLGCMLQKTDASTGAAAFYVNTGTVALPTFSLVDTGTAFSLPTVATDAATTTGTSLDLTTSGLTSGSAVKVTGSGATMTTGVLFNAVMGAAVTGSGFTATTTGVYTGLGLLQLVAASATTGTIGSISAAGLTTGKLLLLTAAAATLTTGRYLSLNDGALEVFGIGADGHVHTAQTTPPSIVVTNQAGITAAAVTAGASDTCGIITTTGTSTGATVLDITFNKTYTTAPKCVVLTPANAAAAMPNTGYFISAIAATGFTITVAAGGTYAATPSFRYLVIA